MRSRNPLSLSAKMARAVLASTLIASGGSALAMDAAKMLTGSEEVPAVSTAATARSAIVVDSDFTVRGSIETSGIDATAAHIHHGAKGVSGPPVVTLVRTGPTTWSVPEGSKFTQSQYEDYKSGNFYVNVHSLAHPAGEIRMQLAP